MGSMLSSGMFFSPALNRDQPFQLYRVTDASAPKRAPVILTWLHGSGGDETELAGMVGALPLIDEAATDAGLADLTVAMPGTGPTWYVDRALAMETAIARNFIDHVEQTLELTLAPKQRLIGGLSMGGYGALRIVLKQPDRFGAAILLSPAIAHDPVPHSMLRQGDIFGAPFDLGAWLREHPVTILANAPPRPDRPPLYLAVGTADGFDLAGPTRAFHEHWQQAGYRSHLVEVPGGQHDAAVWHGTLKGALSYAFSSIA